MKKAVIKLSDIMKNEKLSLSAKDYVHPFEVYISNKEERNSDNRLSTK